MKSIVFITRSLNGGGSQRVFVNLANALCKKYKVSFLVLTGNQCAYLLDPTVDVYWCPENDTLRGFALHLKKNLPRLFKALWCRKMKRRIKPDVAISSLPEANLMNVFSGIGEKLIVREGADPLVIGKKHYCREKIAMHRADHVIFQSRKVQNYFDKKIRAKSSIILNPVEVEIKADNDRANRIVTVGKLTPQKNHHLLIDAFADFLVDHGDYILDIYGIGKLEEELKEHIQRLHLEDKVYLQGFASHVHEEIRNAKMFVLSSDFEGLSNALMESMMMGIACISTRVAGSTEIISNRENGILVDVGDRESLVGAMKLLAEDDSLRKTIEKKAMETSEDFRISRILPKWEVLL